MSSKKRSSKKSLVVLIASSFWVFYVVLTTWQYYISAGRSADTFIESRKTALDYVITTAINTLVDDNISLFESEMKHSRELFLSDFYILQKNDQVLSYSNNGGPASDLNVHYTRYDEMIQTDLLAFKSVRIFDYTLTVGIHTNKSAVILNVLKQDYLIILKDIATVTIFLCALLFLYLKDIISLSKILSSKDRSQISRIHSMSHEGNTLLRASQGFQSEQDHLKGENKHYSNSITPAILHEIKSGRSAPYSFESTMVRVDLNGYTQIFLEKHEEYITQIMNSYFTQAREIIERYEGLVYQYVGDEIVFHIKESKYNSQALAVACIRSLFEVAESIEKNLPPDADHYFKIKSCLATGRMRFANLDTGYGLSGLSLIETARLLTQIEDKSKSSACFYLDAHKSFDFLCEIESHQSTLFKGFQHQAEVARTSIFKDVHFFIKQKDFKKLAYFRSDADLSAVCRHFAAHLSLENEVDFFVATGFVQTLSLQAASDELLASFTNLLSVAVTRNRENWLSDKALSTVIALTSALVPINKGTPELLSLLNDCLNHADHRTCANAILVLGEFSKNPLYLREFIHSSNNRISADAMLVAGKQDFDLEIATQLSSYIKSKNPLYQASGLFVARELIAHHQQLDPVYFEANEHLQRIAALIPFDKKQAA